MRLVHIACQSGSSQPERVQSQVNARWSYGDLFLNTTIFIHFPLVVEVQTFQKKVPCVFLSHLHWRKKKRCTSNFRSKIAWKFGKN